jgi:small subunit ribosomal protein S7
MPRKKTKSLARRINPDSRYNDVWVQRLINKVMLNGKKLVAERLVYSAFEKIEAKTKSDALEVFQTAVKNVSPQLEVKSQRVGGATYQIPFEVRGNRQIHLALSWIVKAARSKSGKNFDEILASELLDAYNNVGDAFKKKEDTHKMAEANRAFAHLARF